MNILFADSQGVVRHGTITIARTIAPSMKVFEESSHHQVCQHLRNEDITMLFLNTDMFEEHSSTSISKFKSISPNLKILLLSTYAEKIFGYHLMQAGADGFISSSYNLSQIANAMSVFLEHGKYISADLQSYKERQAKATAAYQKSIAQKFSSREKMVLEHLRNGTPIIEIAKLLMISPSTVSTYKCRIYGKLGIGNVRELNDLINLAC